MKLKSPRESMVEMTELVLPNDTNLQVCGLLVESDEERDEYEAASSRRCERLKNKR